MADSVQHDLVGLVVAGIQGLDLTGLEDASVVQVTRPADLVKYFPERAADEKLYPLVIVSPFGTELINPTLGTNKSDDIGYPVHVAILDAHKQDQTADQEQWLEWRELIIDHFIHSRLTLTTARPVQWVDLTIEPGLIIDPSIWDQESLFGSTLTLRCTLRRQRRV